jgi:hypothetical protein
MPEQHHDISPYLGRVLVSGTSVTLWILRAPTPLPSTVSILRSATRPAKTHQAAVTEPPTRTAALQHSSQRMIAVSFISRLLQLSRSLIFAESVAPSESQCEPTAAEIESAINETITIPCKLGLRGGSAQSANRLTPI